MLAFELGRWTYIDRPCYPGRLKSSLKFYTIQASKEGGIAWTFAFALMDKTRNISCQVPPPKPRRHRRSNVRRCQLVLRFHALSVPSCGSLFSWQHHPGWYIHGKSTDQHFPEPSHFWITLTFHGRGALSFQIFEGPKDRTRDRTCQYLSALSSLVVSFRHLIPKYMELKPQRRLNGAPKAK